MDRKHTLEDSLTAELSGILNWSLAGLDRLVVQDRFTRPKSTDEAITTLQDLASPVAAFVRDECVTGPTHEVAIDLIWSRWKAWADANGHRPGSKTHLGRDLRAVYPSLRVVQLREGESRSRIYRGIGLRERTGHDDEGSGTPGHAHLTTVVPAQPAPASATHSAAERVPSRASDDSDPESATADDADEQAPSQLRVPADSASEPVTCRDYEAHQSSHRRAATGWVCDACAGQAADDGPDVDGWHTP
jgi:putative DNA primase/helicase